MSNSLTLQERLAQALLIRPNESRIVVYNLGLFVFLGVGLAIGRGTADALFFKRYGIEHLPVVYVLSALSLVVVCTLYAAYADRLSSERFFKYILGILVISLLSVWALMRAPGNDLAYPLYYVVYEIASELILIHAGLYLNQNLDSLQAKRLVPLIFGGSQVGIIIGGIILAVMSPLIGVSNVILIWALSSVISIVMVVYWHRQQGISPFYTAGRKRKLSIADAMAEAFQGVRFMKQSALLKMASLALFFMVIMFYVLIYSINQVYTETFQTEEALSSFFGVLVAVNSSIALVLQFFVASRVLRKFGVKTVNLFFPFTSLFSYLMLMVSFTLPSALVGSLNKDVVMTAFRNPVWNLMMNALPGNIQGRARAMTVAVVIPSALLLAGLILMALKELESPIYIAGVGFVSAAMYFYFSRHMNRVYVAEIISHLKQKLTLPDAETGAALRGGSEAVLQELTRGIQHPDDQIYLAYARSLVDAFPEQASRIIIERLPAAEDKVRDQIIRLLLPLRSSLLPDTLWQLLESSDERFESTCYYGLIILKDEVVREKIPELLSHADARFRVVGVLGVYYMKMTSLCKEAQVVWAQLLSENDWISNMLGLELLDTAGKMDILPDMQGVDFKQAVDRLMHEADTHGLLVSLGATKYLTSQDTEWLQIRLKGFLSHDNRKVRVASLYSCMMLDKDDATVLIEQALEDAHPEVRDLAAKLLNKLEDNSAQAKSDWLRAPSTSSPRAQSAVMKLLLEDNAPQQLFSELAFVKMEEVKQLNEAVQHVKHEQLRSKHSALQVLLLLLEERLQGTIDLTLQALQGTETPDAINAIRMGMQSHETRLRAAAVEALHGLGNKKIGRSLAMIIDSPDYEVGNNFSGVGDVIQWCLNKNDPWLLQCANSAQPQIAT
jgi:ATP/ADP translocase/HEAT repeat protein